MFERFTPTSRRSVVLAQEECRLGGDNKIDVEWLMRGLVIAAPDEIAWAATADEREVERPQCGESPSGHIPFTPDAKRSLEAGAAVARQEGSYTIEVRHVARGIVQLAATNDEIAALVEKYGWEPNDQKWLGVETVDPDHEPHVKHEEQIGHGDFSIGSETYPGVSKTIEEIGELQVVLGKVQQTLGKLIATHGLAAHWDGTDLRECFTDEAGDVIGALSFVIAKNGFDAAAIQNRANEKIALFMKWHAEQGGGPIDTAPVA